MFNARSRVTGLTLGVLCGIASLLILIATAIVLSLIPLYLPFHGSTLNNVQDQYQEFYIEYSFTVGDGNDDYSFITTSPSANERLNKQLTFSPNTITIKNVEFLHPSTSGRRRRETRGRRSLDNRILLISQANYPRMCRNSICQQRFLANVRQQVSDHPNITLQLPSALNEDQISQFDMKFIGISTTVPQDFLAVEQTSTTATAATQTLTNVQLVQNCIGQDTTRNPVIIDTDADVDDLWAITYLLNIPTVDILAITTVGDGYSLPFYSSTTILSLLGLLGCTDGIAVAQGPSMSSLPTGFVIANNILNGIDTYLTSPSCLNQSTNIFLQPSPFESVELLVYTLKYSRRPVDILALGPLTNIAAAIIRDRSIVPKIGTVYISGGQFKSLASYPSLIPNPALGTYPYLKKTVGASDNIFIDVLAAQRVDASRIKNLVAIPSSIQKQLPTNLTQLNLKLKEQNINLTPFIYGLITSLAKCGNESESAIFWWDNSAAQLMIQLQNNVSNGFCTAFQAVQSLYVLSADADQLFGQGIDDFQNTRPNTNGLSNYTICTQTNSDTFITEFLTKISLNQGYSCEATYKNRFDIKLQTCLMEYGFD